jgi:hypothetical protein
MVTERGRAGTILSCCLVLLGACGPSSSTPPPAPNQGGAGGADAAPLSLPDAATVSTPGTIDAMPVVDLGSTVNDAAPGPADVGPPPPPPRDPAEKARIEQTVTAAAHLSPVVPVDRHPITCDNRCLPADREGVQDCSYHLYSETRLFEDLGLLDDQADLWPGNILDGAQVAAGQFVPLGLDLAPITFSVSLQNVPNVTGHVEQPTLSSFRDARNSLLRDVAMAGTSARVTSRLEEIHSQDQVAYAVHAAYGWPGVASLSGSFHFDKNDVKSRILLDFTQVYYSIDINAPSSPADYFAASVNADAVAARIKVGQPPLLVRTVDYGRRILLAVESTETSQAVMAALDASLKFVDASGGVSTDQKTVLMHTSIQASILGGSGAGASQAAVQGFDGIVALLKAEGNYTSEHPGAPIGYHLQYLDGTKGKIPVTSETVEKQCVPAPRTVLANDIPKMITSGQHLDFPFTVTASNAHVWYRLADRSTSSPDHFITGLLTETEYQFFVNGQNWTGHARQSGAAPLAGDSDLPAGSYHFIADCDNIFEACQFSYSVELLDLP